MLCLQTSRIEDTHPLWSGLQLPSWELPAQTPAHMVCPSIWSSHSPSPCPGLEATTLRLMQTGRLAGFIVPRHEARVELGYKAGLSIYLELYLLSLAAKKATPKTSWLQTTMIYCFSQVWGVLLLKVILVTLCHQGLTWGGTSKMACSQSQGYRDHQKATLSWDLWCCLKSSSPHGLSVWLPHLDCFSIQQLRTPKAQTRELWDLWKI